MTTDSLQERVNELKERLKKTPINKGTEKDRARLKAQIAKLEEKKEQQKKKGGYGYGYGLKKRGDLTVCLVGYPSTGKSTLLNTLTGSKSEVGEYEFTTLDVIPGAIIYNGALIQIWDVPGLIEGASEGRGRGKEVINVIRNTDIIIMLTDPKRAEKIDKLLDEIYNAGIRLNKEKPEIKIEKKDRGGITIGSTSSLDLDISTLKEMCIEYGLANADIVIRSKIDLDDFIDALVGNRIYIPFILIINKIDTLDETDLEAFRKKFSDAIFISAKEGVNVEELKRKIWDKSGLMRIYMKRIGNEPDMDEPLIMAKNSTIEDVCIKIHKLFLSNFRYARIWGKSAKFDEQQVGKDHRLKDKDIIELHFRK